MFNQLKSTPELLKETNIIFKIKTEIIYLVFEHCRSFYTHSESKSRVFSAVDITGFKNGRMNHATSEDLKPAGMFANITALSTANGTAHIHLSRWFREGEV